MPIFEPLPEEEEKHLFIQTGTATGETVGDDTIPSRQASRGYVEKVGTMPSRRYTPGGDSEKVSTMPSRRYTPGGDSGTVGRIPSRRQARGSPSPSAIEHKYDDSENERDSVSNVFMSSCSCVHVC